MANSPECPCILPASWGTGPQTPHLGRGHACPPMAGPGLRDGVRGHRNGWQVVVGRDRPAPWPLSASYRLRPEKPPEWPVAESTFLLAFQRDTDLCKLTSHWQVRGALQREAGTSPRGGSPGQGSAHREGGVDSRPAASPPHRPPIRRPIPGALQGPAPPTHRSQVLPSGPPGLWGKTIKHRGSVHTRPQTDSLIPD